MHGLRGFSLKRKVQCTNVNRMGVVGASSRIGANHYEMHNKTVAGEYWRRHSPHHVNLTLRRHGVDWLSCLLASCWLVRGATAARTALASSPALSCSSWRDGKWADAVQLDTNRWAPSACVRHARATAWREYDRWRPDRSTVTRLTRTLLISFCLIAL